jgi:murein DD-endopeptidase MepM/ murein hydrolase activator NlpD
MRKSFWVSITLGLLAYLVLPLPGSTKPLSERIDATRAKIDRKKHREGVLTDDISAFQNRIRGLQGQIRSLQQRQARIQVSLDRKRAELLEVRDRLEKAKDRLERLRADLKVAEAALANRLVEIYKDGQPDVLTVVLESNGFADMLERTDYLKRVSDQDRQIVSRVRVLKRQAAEQTRLLADLEQKVEAAADAILAKRNQLAAAKAEYANSRDQLATARDGRRQLLSKVRDQRQHAQEDLESLEKEQARVQAALQGSPGPIKKGSGRLIWPVNGPISGVFGENRGDHIHQGIDIVADEGVPIRAADGGRVALAGWTGGYGNYTCIQHNSSLSTCYAHQSRIGVSVGQTVKQGQVIGAVGNTGHSFGAHLHFEVRINGTAVDPMGYL